MATPYGIQIGSVAEAGRKPLWLQRFGSGWQWLENSLAASALVAMVLLPVIEVSLRTFFNTGLTGTTDYVQHLTLWVAFLGAMLAAREGRHLSLASGELVLPPPLANGRTILISALSVMVALCLAWASLQFVRFELASAARVGGVVPVWIAELILPVAFTAIAIHFMLRSEAKVITLCSVVGLTAGIFLLEPFASQLVWPVIIVLIVAGILGLPIFVVLGGIALMLFVGDGVPAAAVPVETYRIVVSPTIPAIPLFTLAGFVLAAGNASARLVRLFRALLGWLPGGLVIATILVCAFFSTFTGASGVTILALGGLLLPVLLKNGYPERFSVGLLTATGSIGLLFPPSLAVIMYGVVAQVPIPDLFKAGIVPGMLMVSAVCAFAVFKGVGADIPRSRFDASEAAAAAWESKWEILLPVIVLTAIFGGFTTLIEAAAITAFYTLVIETLVHRELHFTRDLPGILVKCVTMLGGIFAILGVAMGLTNYLVDAMVPMHAAAWVEAHVESRLVFLLTLNVCLLIVGCLMDIFSAIFVVVPLIIPMAKLFGIDPLHLGMIFLVNLELGYLTPPVGMNLFLASYRLERPLIEVYRSTFPFLLVLLMVVLTITYIPALTIGAY
jgi:tripartite ATP-independent transporter DctM subunit